MCKIFQKSEFFRSQKFQVPKCFSSPSAIIISHVSQTHTLSNSFVYQNHWIPKTSFALKCTFLLHTADSYSWVKTQTVLCPRWSLPSFTRQLIDVTLCDILSIFFNSIIITQLAAGITLPSMLYWPLACTTIPHGKFNTHPRFLKFPEDEGRVVFRSCRYCHLWFFISTELLLWVLCLVTISCFYKYGPQLLMLISTENCGKQPLRWPLMMLAPWYPCLVQFTLHE